MRGIFRFRSAVGAFALVLCLAAPAAAAARNECALALGEVFASASTYARRISTLRSLTEGAGVKRPRFERRRVFPATLEVIEDHRARGAPFPAVDGMVSDLREIYAGVEAIRREWVPAMRAAHPDLPAIGSLGTPLPAERMMEGGRSHVLRIDYRGRWYFFRPAESEKQADIARKTLAASLLNRMLGRDTVPEARLALVNGRFGVLSDLAPGFSPWLPLRWKKLAPDSRADTEAFEFLVGNIDSRKFNLHIGPGKRIQVYDHDLAFTAEVPHYDPDYDFGSTLPERYTPGFLEALRDASAEKLRGELGPHLTSHEMDALLVRREIILKDAERRGEAAVLR